MYYAGMNLYIDPGIVLKVNEMVGLKKRIHGFLLPLNLGVGYLGTSGREEILLAGQGTAVSPLLYSWDTKIFIPASSRQARSTAPSCTRVNISMTKKGKKSSNLGPEFQNASTDYEKFVLSTEQPRIWSSR